MAKLERRRKFFKSLEAKSLRQRTWSSQLADDLTSFCGSPHFLLLNLFFFAVWVIINSGAIPFLLPFDPYPFIFLTMLVSLEAIMLSIFVLISQNRSAHISTIREEVHLQLNLRAEEEITKILEMLKQIRKKMEIDKSDPDLEQMLEQTDLGYIEKNIINQMERANKPLWKELVNEFPLGVPKKPETNGHVKEEHIGVTAAKSTT